MRQIYSARVGNGLDVEHERKGSIKNDLLVSVLEHEGGWWSPFTETRNWDRVTDGRGTMRKQDILSGHV